MEGGEGADAGFELAGGGADAAFLGDVGAIGQQFGQDLEAGDDVGREAGGKPRHVVQDAVEPPADFEGVGRGVEVEVAGA